MAFPLAAIGAGIGIAAEQIQKQRQDQQRLALQQLAAERDTMLLRQALKKQQTQDDEATLLGAGGGTAGPTAPIGQAGGMPGSQFASPGGGLAGGLNWTPAARALASQNPADRAVFGLPGTPAPVAGMPGNAWSVGATGIPFRLPSMGGGGVTLPFGPDSGSPSLNIGPGAPEDITAFADINAAPFTDRKGRNIGSGQMPPPRNDALGGFTPPPSAVAEAQSGGDEAPVKPTQVAQAGAATMSDAGPALTPPDPQQILRQVQEYAVSQGINPRSPAVAQRADAMYKQALQNFNSQRVLQHESDTLAETRRGRAETERHNRFEETHQTQQDVRASKSEEYNAQITLPNGQTESAMVYTKKGQPGYYYQGTGEQVPKGSNVLKSSGAMGATMPDDEANMLADAAMAGDRSVFQGLGYGNQGALNREKVYKAMMAKGATGGQIAAARAEFAATMAGAQTAGRRGAQIGMAINELKQFIPEAKRISELVDRTSFPTLNSLLLSAEAGTGGEDVRRLALVTNEVINAYAQVATRGGIPTDSAREQGHAILNNAFTKGQYAAALDEMMSLATAAQAAPGATIKETTDRLRNLYGGEGGQAAPAAPGGAAAPPQPGAVWHYDAQGNRVQ